MHCRWYPSMPCSRSRGGGVGWLVSQHALQVSRPTPRGEVEGSGQGGSPGPHSRGELRSLAWGGGSPGPHPLWGVSRSTPLVGGLQAHTWGVSRPTPGGGVVSQHAPRQTPPTASDAGSTHPIGMHSCSLKCTLSVILRSVDL